MMNWLFRRKTISSILEAELEEALISFHNASAAKEDWKSRKSMLRGRIIRLRNQITLAKAQESWKSTSGPGSSLKTDAPGGRPECLSPSSAPTAATFGGG